MRRRNWEKSRFETDAVDPMDSMANLVDVMLVFACGLIAALVVSQGGLKQKEALQPKEIEKKQELPEMPQGVGAGGEGYEPVGQVYKDSTTGKLILISE